MKVLIIGSNSFLSKEIKNYFYNENFIYVDRKILDLENKINVDNFFKNNYFDFVVNTCTVGGKTNVVDKFSVLSSNVLMFNNLLNVNHRYGYLFNFCSGAAFDRRKEISEVSEHEIYLFNPIDYYGLSKNIIAREILKNENIFNFRIFGSFGDNELNTRFVKNSLNRIKEKKDIVIYKDKYMDFISSYDICKILQFYIEYHKDIQYKDINLVYKQKIKLSDFAEIILKFKKSNQCAIIMEDGLDKSYTGNNERLNSMPINLHGIESSLIRLKND